ncbi:MAG: hypothetical protein MR619_05120, partial [Eubacterium sp.]|nr:hypothetical protein [Eubacterium sp.]
GDFDDWEKDYISNQKTAITKKYKQQYINGDLEERKKIIAYMESTGYYGSRSDIIKYIKQYWL